MDLIGKHKNCTSLRRRVEKVKVFYVVTNLKLKF